ncbi:MAG: 2-amino-4-hydroxy-6-hydroxymethyldihydropteridine diphosphokinase [Proteobacteria bacterium]|nr:2-amino-4-hydroxy-6-hydroxymethyldihydropteridine diphosphokinase [Pseudomonadota bacterium]
MDSVFISIGSNRGNRAAMCHEAITRMGSLKDVTVISKSALYETEPVGLIAEGPFINCVVELSTTLAARELLGRLKEIEVELGRVKARRWAPRIIDLDILFYGTEIIDEDGLCIPHRELVNRAFVLIPMAEIAGGFCHPLLGTIITELAAQVEDQGGVKRYEGE